METKDTAVALLKEWKSHIDMDKWTLDHPNHFSRKFVIENMEKAEVLSRRLDEITGAAGISIINGQFAYDSDKTEWRLESDGGRFFTNLPAREQQAIQEWLLIKNEEKTA
jgi:hypothetical protein